MEFMKELVENSTAVGSVEWIGIASSPRQPHSTLRTAELIAGRGISGDHHAERSKTSKRQVTLIQQEHLPVVAALLKKEQIDPADLRRNIVVSGINLAVLRRAVFQVGTAVLRGTGNCPPCSRMEENLGPGGYAAMLSHGGIIAVVETAGTVSLGDSVRVLNIFSADATSSGRTP
ncbi:MAG: MOSC domain-containing protein [Planctomycetaceae bacterium]|nr:MOSC domain-containing protein [Planctomycetaceae bacterium]